MNPEVKYPELKEMKSNEVFVEWAYAVKNNEHKATSEVLKIQLCRIIPKAELKAFVKALRLEYNATEIDLATISK